MAEMEFRANFLAWIVVNAIWAFVVLGFVHLIYTQVDNIAGWDRGSAMLLVVIHEIFISLLWIFILPNATRFYLDIRRGDLDFALLRPVNLRFLVSTRRVEFDQALRLLILFFLFTRFAGEAEVILSPAPVILFILTVALGLIIFYNIFYIIETLNIWLVNIFNLENLFDAITEAGKFPSQIFQGSARIFFYYIVPVVFIATFPTQILLGRSGVEITIVAIVMAVVTSLFSNRFWNFALKHYTSASS